MNDDREEKIASIKAQIDSNTYDVSGEEIASSMLLVQQNHAQQAERIDWLESALEIAEKRHHRALDRIEKDALTIHQQKMAIYALAFIAFFGWFVAYGFWPRN